MLIMWFSGLRGAIAYALSLHLEFDEDTRKVLVTTTLVVVLFTTIGLGGSTMPFMKYLESRQPRRNRYIELSRGFAISFANYFFSSDADVARRSLCPRRRSSARRSTPST